MEEFRHALAVTLWRESFARYWERIGWAAIADAQRIASLRARARRGVGL